MAEKRKDADIEARRLAADLIDKRQTLIEQARREVDRSRRLQAALRKIGKQH